MAIIFKFSCTVTVQIVFICYKFLNIFFNILFSRLFYPSTTYLGQTILTPSDFTLKRYTYTINSTLGYLYRFSLVKDLWLE